MVCYNNAKKLILESTTTGCYPTNLGDVPIDTCEVVIFPHGLLGFEGLTDYFFAPLLGHQADSPFRLLQSLQAPTICFITMKLELVEEAYIRLNDLLPFAHRTGLSIQELDVYLVVSIDKSSGVTETSVNLKAPVIHHPGMQHAWQIVLDNPNYPLNFKLN